MEKVRFGVIGLGGRGHGMMCGNLFRFKDIEITAVCDAYADRAERSADAVEEKYGKKIPQIFAEKGEGYFRDLESEAVFEASIKTGGVIATGGGAVLREENRRYLLQNGKVVFLNRDITKLPTNGRPLSKDASALEEMLKIRLPIYRGLCDKEITVEESIDENVKKILGQ